MTIVLSFSLPEADAVSPVMRVHQLVDVYRSSSGQWCSVDIPEEGGRREWTGSCVASVDLQTKTSTFRCCLGVCDRL